MTTTETKIILRLPTDREYWTNGDDDLTHVIANVSADWEAAVRRKYPDADVSLELVPSSVSHGGKTQVLAADGIGEDEIAADVLSIRESIDWTNAAMWEAR